MQKIIDSLDANLPFISELLQADIRLFVKEPKKIYLHNYYHPAQDSLFMDYKKGKELEPHKDITVNKAFDSGKTVMGQYGLVINNRPIQEFAYPLVHEDEVLAVIAVERDIYLTRYILGEHWDFIAENLIKALKDKTYQEEKFPNISPGEGAIFLQKELISYANPLAVSLVGEIVENVRQLVQRDFNSIFASYQRKSKGNNPYQSINLIEEITLSQKTLNLRHIELNSNFSVVLIKDISEIKVRETLLREIHHRVKNNLQTITSLLRMQKRRNPEIGKAFREAIHRIASITLVHEYLSLNGNIEQIDFGQLVNNIIKELITGFDTKGVKLNYHCPEKVYINSEIATNLALVINELVTNAFEHAGDNFSCLDINLSQEKSKLKIEIRDNGDGFPKDFSYKKSTGLGWEIIRGLAEESMGADLQVGNDNGAKVLLSVPEIV